MFDAQLCVLFYHENEFTMKSTKSLKLVVLCIVAVGAILGFATYVKSGNLQAKIEYSSLNTAPQVNSEADVKFLKSAAEINNAQYDLGRLAQNSCLRREVCHLGEMMEKNYSNLNGKLKSLARDKSVEISTLPTLKAQGEYKKVSFNLGSYFDKAFCALVISDLIDAITIFDRATVECTDPDVKNYAASELSDLRNQFHNTLTIQQNYKQESPIGLNE